MAFVNYQNSSDNGKTNCKIGKTPGEFARIQFDDISANLSAVASERHGSLFYFQDESSCSFSHKKQQFSMKGRKIFRYDLKEPMIIYKHICKNQTDNVF